MEFGVQIFPTDQTIQPVELGLALEEHGFESVWFAEHSHIPTSRATPAGGVPGAPPLPEKYWRVHHAFVALAAVSAVTKYLKLGTGVTLVPQHDPIWLAKMVASLDSISKGRVLLGIGYGWNAEEFAGHEPPLLFKRRKSLLREKLGLMRTLWTDEVASYQGNLVQLQPAWAWPKPYQRPHPPVLLGAPLTPMSAKHLVEFCDGWMPNRGYVDDLENKVAQIRSSLVEAGRSPKDFSFSFYGATDTSPEFLEHLHSMEFTRVIFGLESDPPGEVLERVSHYAAVISDYRARHPKTKTT